MPIPLDLWTDVRTLKKFKDSTIMYFRKACSKDGHNSRLEDVFQKRFAAIPKGEDV